MQGSPFGLVYLAVDEPEGDPNPGKEKLNSPKTTYTTARTQSNT